MISAGEQIHWLLVRGPPVLVAELIFGNTTVTIRFRSVYGETWGYRSGNEEKVED